MIGELLRILKPNGVIILSFSNRAFWTKAIQIWKESNEAKRVYIGMTFFQYYSDILNDINAYSIQNITKNGDPMYVVMATKKSNECNSDT